MKHSNCKIIGLTGGIASGKSAVTSILIKKGYKVIDSDIIAREVVEPGKPAIKKITRHFGEGILDDNGSLNRKALGNLVFSNSFLLKDLNNIIHPYIFKEVKENIYKECILHDYIFVDIPLLFETYDNLQNQGIVFDEIWLVYVDEETQLKRLMERNNLKKKQAIDRINIQIPLEKKKKKSTRIIDNNGDLTQLNENVEELLKEFA